MMANTRTPNSPAVLFFTSAPRTQAYLGNTAAAPVLRASHTTVRVGLDDQYPPDRRDPTGHLTWVSGSPPRTLAKADRLPIPTENRRHCAYVEKRGVHAGGPRKGPNLTPPADAPGVSAPGFAGRLDRRRDHPRTGPRLPRRTPERQRRIRRRGAPAARARATRRRDPPRAPPGAGRTTRRRRTRCAVRPRSGRGPCGTR